MGECIFHGPIVLVTDADVHKNGRLVLEQGREPYVSITKSTRLVKILEEEEQGLGSTWPGVFCECTICGSLAS